MKTPATAFLVIALSAAPVCAQSSPAGAESKTAAAQTGTLTKEERDRAIDYLKQTQKDFLDEIDGVSDEQWKFKAAPDRWSIAETAEHIALAEDVIWQRFTDAVMKSPAAPEKRAEVAGKDEIILKVIPDRSQKAKAPEILQPTGKFRTREELVTHFKQARAREIALLNETKEDLRSHFAEHPFLKTMDGYQWLIFNGAHCKRHTAQIVEVKADANYPKS